jgi:hypothetical protein
MRSPGPIAPIQDAVRAHAYDRPVSRLVLLPIRLMASGAPARRLSGPRDPGLFTPPWTSAGCARFAAKSVWLEYSLGTPRSSRPACLWLGRTLSGRDGGYSGE